MNLNIKILAIIKIAILSLGFAISISPSFAKTTLKEVPTSPDSGETIPKDVKDLIYHGGFTGGGGGTGVRLYETKQWVLHELLALLPTYTGINKLTIDGTTY